MKSGRMAGRPAGAALDTLLRGAPVYLSGPMDFVASRETEKKYGRRTRVGDPFYPAKSLRMV